MSITLVPPRLSSSIPSLARTRWAFLTVLLVAEGVVLTHRFHVPRFSAAGPWWGLPLAHARALLIPGLLAAGTMALLGGARSIRDRAVLGVGSRSRFGLAVAAQLAAFAVFVAWTAQVFEGDALTSRWPAAWVLGWYGSGLVLVASWLAAWQPLGWRGFLKLRKLGIIAVGMAVGVGAFACSQFAGHLWGPMASATLVIVRASLSLVASNVISDPALALIGVDDFAVVIAPACSGYEGIGLVWAFLAVYLVAFRRSLRWPRAWWLIPLGTIAIWLVNSARITALVLIGAWVSPQVALGGFHSQAGSLGILAISLGLVALSRQTRCFTADQADAEADPGELAPVVNPTAAYLVPFLAVIGTTMVTGALSAGFDALYPLRIVAGGAALWFCRRSYPGRWFDGSWVAAGIGLLVFGLWVALEPARPAAGRALQAHYAQLATPWAGVWLPFRVIGSVVVVPLVEELAFRGYLTRRLIASDFESVPLGRFTWLSFLLSSAAFGLLHGRWFAGMLAGLIYAGAYYRRGRVGDAALAHAVTNGLIALTVLVTDDWTMWS